MDTTKLVPPWLEELLTSSFFTICRTHGDAARSECNMFCLDCGGDPFCFYCRSSRHKDHQVIQVRATSFPPISKLSESGFLRHCGSFFSTSCGVFVITDKEVFDVVRISEIQKVLDISGVQTYVINSARVMFLNERPQPKAGMKGVPHICEICSRGLLDPFRFCSLGCKLVGIKRNGDANFTLEARNEEGNGNGRRVGMNTSSTTRVTMGEEELREGSQQDMYPDTPPPPPSSTTRRRKGIPHRAPFGT